MDNAQLNSSAAVQKSVHFWYIGCSQSVSWTIVSTRGSTTILVRMGSASLLVFCLVFTLLNLKLGQTQTDGKFGKNIIL